VLNEKERDELSALIEHEKNNLRFYALYYDMFREKLLNKELEKQINFHLDRMIELSQKLKGK
jgi:hypothetical protein